MSNEEKKKNYLTYGTIISFMLDNTDPNDTVTINYDAQRLNSEVSKDKNEDFLDFLMTRGFLFTHGVFNDYCYFYQFKNKKDIRDYYLNTLYVVIPAFEFDSMDALNKIIKRIKQGGVSQSSEMGISKQQIYDSYIRFKQEVETNHDASIKLMKKENNTVNYDDCVQFLHLKSGKFLEHKYNNKTLKTYVQLTNNMSKRTLFRFQPAYDYQSETSTHCLFNLAIKVACGDKKAKKDKYIVDENIPGLNENSLLCMEQGNIKDKKEENIKEGKKTIFTGENLKNTINAIYNDGSQDPKIIDEFVTYSMRENLQQKNLGIKLMPEEDNIVVNSTSFNFWRIMNFSEDYFEDLKYLNLFDFFCIQNQEKHLFINLEEVEKDEFNFDLDGDNINLNINNNKKELYPIKEEKDELNDNKSEIKSGNKSDILDKEERKQISFIMKKDLGYVRNKNNVTDSTIEFMDNQIDINYFFDSNYNKNKKYKLIVDTYNDKEHLKPYSLFRIEREYDIFDDVDINTPSKNNNNIIPSDMNVRLINVFTNKVLYANKTKNNQYKLYLVDDMGRDDKTYKNSLFSLKKIRDIQEIDESKDENEGEGKKDEDRNENQNNFGFKKSDFVKIYSVKYSAYLGIRLANEKNSKELILTNSMSDITKFKLNYLDEEDRYELNFFEQLLLGFDNILNYFKHENKSVTIVSQNYERIKHILITLRLKLNQFKNDHRDVKNLNLQENKFDFIEIIQHFNIVSKLIELFLSNWFRNYNGFNYTQLNYILNKYFTDNNDILKYKLLISREILAILSLIYEFNHSYLNVIEDYLLYFFMFIGRDDKCTKFLVDILNNNKLLIISLCPLSKENIEIKEEPIDNDEIINEINSISMIADNEELLKRKNKNKKSRFNDFKRCLIRIIKHYNNMDIEDLRINFSSLVLFFNLMYNLLILDNEPFIQFYNDYFKDLGVLKPTDNNQLMPNYEQNSILIGFHLIENEIFVKKKAFNNKESNESNRLIDFKLDNLIDILSNYNYDTENERNDILFAKLVCVNLYFYSFLSLCDDKFKKYMKNIFKFENLINNYLSLTYNIIKKFPDAIINKEEKKQDNNNIIEK